MNADEFLDATQTLSFDESDMPTETIEFFPLSANDRCDRDPAEAAVAQVRLPSGGNILLCGHHWRQNEDKLSIYPHSVPVDESKPFTFRRSQELGAPAQRDAGSSL